VLTRKPTFARVAFTTAFVTSLLILPGCARLFRLVPERNQANIEALFIDGHQWACTRDKSALVAIKAEKREADILTLTVGISNYSQQRFDVIPEAIRVIAIEDDTEVPLQVWSPDDFMNDRRGRQATAIALMAVAGGLAAVDAGRTTYTTQTSGSLYGSSGTYLRGTQRSVTTVDDPTAREAALVRNQREINQASSSFTSQNNIIEACLLKSTTLFPGKDVMGEVMVKCRDADRYRVELTLGKSDYQIYFVPASSK
jgi:hypothetical protein